MRFMLIRTLFFALALIPTVLMAQGRRIDTTMKVGKAGFRVNCYNKSSEKIQSPFTRLVLKVKHAILVLN